MNIASVYRLIGQPQRLEGICVAKYGSCPTPRNLSEILRLEILLIYVIAQHQTHYGDHCNLPADARIHEICTSVLFFHKGTAGTIFDPPNYK